MPPPAPLRRTRCPGYMMVPYWGTIIDCLEPAALPPFPLTTASPRGRSEGPRPLLSAPFHGFLHQHVVRPALGDRHGRNQGQARLLPHLGVRGENGGDKVSQSRLKKRTSGRSLLGTALMFVQKRSGSLCEPMLSFSAAAMLRGAAQGRPTRRRPLASIARQRCRAST